MHSPRAAILGEWRLVQVARPGARLRSVSEAVSRRAFVRFDNDGGLSGRGGCNSFHANYNRQGDRLVVGQLTTTKMLCRGEAGTVEADFYAGLPMTASFTASRGDARVTLLDRFAAPLAVLERR